MERHNEKWKKRKWKDGSRKTEKLNKK